MLYGTKIKISTLERWFNHSEVKKAWHINFDDYRFKINADINSFYIAYAHLLKLMINKNEGLGFIVNTRTIDSNLQKILNFLPKVKPLQESGTGKPTGDDTEKPISGDTEKPIGGDTEKPIGGDTGKPSRVDTGKPTDGDTKIDKQELIGDPNRKSLAYKKYIITTDNYRLHAIFQELKRLPTQSYPQLSAAGIRIFLELSINNYLSAKDLQSNVAQEKNKRFDDVTLTEKLKYLSKLNLDSKQASSTLKRLLNYTNDYSIHTLNKYIHENTTDKINREFLNNFWDILIPLFEVLVDMREEKKES